MGPWEFSAVWDISWNLLAFTGLLRRDGGAEREKFGLLGHLAW